MNHTMNMLIGGLLVGLGAKLMNGCSKIILI